MVYGYYLSLACALPTQTDTVRLALEARSERWFLWLLVMSGIVAVGCLLEVGETWTDLRRWFAERQKPGEMSEDARSWRVPLSALGLSLVVLGVIGEGVFEGLASHADTQLRAHESEILSDAESLAAASNMRAGTANERAAAANERAARANERAGNANAAAGRAAQKAEEARLGETKLTRANLELTEEVDRERTERLEAEEAASKAQAELHTSLGKVEVETHGRYLDEDALIAKLKGQAIGAVRILYDENDADAESLAWQVEWALIQDTHNPYNRPVNAGWTLIDIRALTPNSELNMDFKARLGLTIVSHDVQANDAAKALAQALTQCISTSPFVSQRSDPRVPAGEINLVVGQKW